eukprot:scaffold140115_cov44-Attheya_sp.AAC.2
MGRARPIRRHCKRDLMLLHADCGPHTDLEDSRGVVHRGDQIRDRSADPLAIGVLPLDLGRRHTARSRDHRPTACDLCRTCLVHLWPPGAAGPRIVSIAIVRDQYAGSQMARIMSLVMAVFIIVPTIAPAIGQGIDSVVRSLACDLCRLILLGQGIIAGIWFAIRQPETLAPADRLPLSPARVGRAMVETFTNRVALGYTIAAGLEIKQAAVDYMHPEKPVEMDSTCARNYFGRPSADAEEEDANERDLILQEMQNLLTEGYRRYQQAITERPTFIAPIVCLGRQPSEFGRKLCGRADTLHNHDGEKSKSGECLVSSQVRVGSVRVRPRRCLSDNPRNPHVEQNSVLAGVTEGARVGARGIRRAEETVGLVVASGAARVGVRTHRVCLGAFAEAHAGPLVRLAIDVPAHRGQGAAIDARNAASLDGAAVTGFARGGIDGGTLGGVP